MRFVDTSRVRTLIDERLPACDGVELSVDIYRPAAVGAYPVLITRTAADNNRASWAPPRSTAPAVPADRYKLIAEHGFIVVAADARGRGDSDGDFRPFRSEAADGAALVSWARHLPDGDGRVGAFGSGYAGFAALAVAADVDALAVWSPFGGADLPARGGVVRLDWLFWQHLVGGRFVQPANVPDWERIFRHRPARSMPEALGRADVPWGEWMSHLAHNDAYWEPLRTPSELARGCPPMLVVSGWWDATLTSTLELWQASSDSAPGAARRLVIGPWDTTAVRHPAAEVGGVAWGPASVVDHDELLIDWFRRCFTNDDPDPNLDRRARVFVTGRNMWSDLPAWPPPSQTVDFWLDSSGRANSRIGDGRLVAESPAAVMGDSFVHDPTDPVRWQPEGATFSRSSPVAHTLDSGFATSRDDVLVYTSPARSERVEFAGMPVVYLRATTDADDADWFVSLEDVFPGGGRSVRLAHGIVRASTLAEVIPGRSIDYVIPMTEIAHEVQPGHALRLVVASSCFPLYAVNGGATDDIDALSTRRSRHTVLHGGTGGSRLVLPLHLERTANDQTP